MDYGFDHWFYKAVANENDQKFNCSVPFHPTVISRMTGNSIEICKNPDKGRMALESYLTFYDTGSQTPETKPCSIINTYLEPSDINFDMDKQKGFTRLYSNTEVKIKTIILYYDSNALFADLGGYLGMILGVSLLDFIAMCNSAWFKIIAMKFK